MLSLLLLAALHAPVGPPPAQGAAWRVGEPLPDLALPVVHGPGTEAAGPVALRSFTGTKLLLIEFASW